MTWSSSGLGLYVCCQLVWPGKEQMTKMIGHGVVSRSKSMSLIYTTSLTTDRRTLRETLRCIKRRGWRLLVKTYVSWGLTSVRNVVWTGYCVAIKNKTCISLVVQICTYLLIIGHLGQLKLQDWKMTDLFMRHPQWQATKKQCKAVSKLLTC